MTGASGAATTAGRATSRSCTSAGSRRTRSTGTVERTEPSYARSTIARRTGDSVFLGYETTTADGRVQAIIRDAIEYDTLEAVPDVETCTSS